MAPGPDVNAVVPTAGPEFQPNYIDPVSIGHRATNAYIISTVFAFIFVALRIFTKARVTRMLWWDDFVDLGLGRHLIDVPPTSFTPLNIFNASNTIVYIYAIVSAKLAVLLLLYRIFGVDNRFRWFCRIFAPIMLCWAIITSFVQLFRCRPFIAAYDAEWTLNRSDEMECLDRILNIVIFCHFNVYTDFILMLAPMPMLLTMQLTWQKKLGISTVFLTGGMYVVFPATVATVHMLIEMGLSVCAMSIARLVTLYRNNQSGATDTDGSYTEIPNHVFAALEVNVGIIAGCLPVIHPLLRRVPKLKDILPVSLRSIFSSHSIGGGSSRSKLNSKRSGPDARGIPLAEKPNSTVVGKKPSQDSGNETLVDRYGRDDRDVENNIMRTDQYDVRSESLGDGKEPQMEENYVYRG
ncbi:MAG: hypothetical protein Q9183_005068 [Haloplaca sp. 2 TL-2023]